MRRILQICPHLILLFPLFNKHLFYWVHFEVEKQMFSFLLTKRRQNQGQNETEITEMDHSLPHLFVSLVIAVKWKWKHIENTTKKDQVSSVWGKWWLEVDWIESSRPFEGFSTVDEGGNVESASPTSREKAVAWLRHILRCFMLEALWTRMRVRSATTHIAVPFYFPNSPHQYSITNFLFAAMSAATELRKVNSISSNSRHFFPFFCSSENHKRISCFEAIKIVKLSDLRWQFLHNCCRWLQVLIQFVTVNGTNL